MSSKDNVQRVLGKMRQEVVDVVSTIRASTKDAPLLPIAQVEPNTWNPNEMEKGALKKLRAGVELLLKQGVQPPPIVVRELARGRYQIIDGYHRWLVFKDLKQAEIPAVTVNVDDATARILTDTLNYLRGQPDRLKYSEFIADLVKDQGKSLDDLALLLPESKDELSDILQESDAGLAAIMAINEREDAVQREEDAASLQPENTWLELNFKVTQPMAEVIEREIARIESTLAGKNRRGRALEFMAATSAATPLPDAGAPKPKKKER